MRTSTDRERSYRRAVAGGVVLSVAAHIAVFAFGGIVVEPTAEAGRSIRLVQLPDNFERSEPLEVVQLRVQPEFTESKGGSASSYSAECRGPGVCSDASQFAAGNSESIVPAYNARRRRKDRKPASELCLPF